MFSEWQGSKLCQLFESGNVLIKAFSLSELCQLHLCIFGGIGIGESSLEICFK
jgi:hypothetical protein